MRGLVSLKVYDILGREVAVLASGEMAAGTHSKVWDASRFATGVYFYRLKAGNYCETKKLLLLK
jgi:Secretion system C-terminal sorting domain